MVCLTDLFVLGPSAIEACYHYNLSRLIAAGQAGISVLSQLGKVSKQTLVWMGKGLTWLWEWLQKEMTANQVLMSQGARGERYSTVDKSLNSVLDRTGFEF